MTLKITPLNQLNFNRWGMVTAMLDPNDPRSTIQQLDEGYRHGGGWHHFDGFELDMDNYNLTYPGDPPYRPIEATQLRDDLIILYPHAWFLVLHPDKTWQVCRMD